MSINKTYAVLGLGRYGKAVAEEIVKALKANHPNESNELDRLLSLISSAGSIMKE